MTPVGTVDIPDRVDRERYFRALSYLELSALFAGPLKPSALQKWVALAPERGIGLAAPSVLTHRAPPKSSATWSPDASSGDFRDSAPGRVALAALRDAVDQLGARCVVFRSPAMFAPSAANREQLKKFFAEVASEEAIGTQRVWVPGGLWEVRTAIKLANELGVTCSIDPLVREPGMPPEIHYDLEVDSLYLRVEGVGRTSKLDSERLDDLAMLVEHYEDIEVTVAFASPERWNDAKNFRKLLPDVGAAPDADEIDDDESSDEIDDDEN